MSGENGIFPIQITKMFVRILVCVRDTVFGLASLYQFNDIISVSVH